MTDLDALLAAIIATPDDDAARLVYADKYQDLDTEEARARAEFIRVQVELANSRKTRVDRGFLIVDDVSEDALRERERELLQITATDGELPFRLVWAGFDSYTTATGIDWIFSRGFIAEVRGPEAALVGGECGRCAGTGIYTGDEMVCSACKGVGEFSAVLPAIAQAHPLEWVRAVDAIHEDRRFPGGHRINREQFPQELWLSLISRAALSFKGIVPPDANAITDTREELEELLSRALIAWARKEQTCTT